MSKEIEKAVANVIENVYEDARESVVKPTAEIIGLIPRTIRAVLSKYEVWVMEREYYLKECQKRLERKLSFVDREHIVEPDLQLLVPTIIQMSYSINNNEICDIYANLLCASMIDFTKNKVHPGFVEVIRQLTPDEARILKYLTRHSFMEIPIINVFAHDGDNIVKVLRNYSDIGYKANCELPQEVAMCIANLLRLSLVEREVRSICTSDHPELHEKIYNSEFVQNKIQDKGYENPMPYYNYESLHFTDFGKNFCTVCILNPAELCAIKLHK